MPALWAAGCSTVRDRTYTGSGPSAAECAGIGPAVRQEGSPKHIHMMLTSHLPQHAQAQALAAEAGALEGKNMLPACSTNCALEPATTGENATAAAA